MNNLDLIETHTLSSIGPTFSLDKNIISENVLLARLKGTPMMFNLSCITPTTPFPMEEDLPFKEEIARHALSVKEVALAPWM